MKRLLYLLFIFCALGAKAQQNLAIYGAINNSKGEPVAGVTVYWGFELNYHPFNTIFDKRLMNENSPEITFNEQLKNEAINVKEQLMPFLSYQ
jgi:hypothetical protein